MRVVTVPSVHLSLLVWNGITIIFKVRLFSCSVTQSCPILCDPMDCSKSGFPVPQYLLEFTQTHVH